MRPCVSHESLSIIFLFQFFVLAGALYSPQGFATGLLPSQTLSLLFLFCVSLFAFRTVIAYSLFNTQHRTQRNFIFLFVIMLRPFGNSCLPCMPRCLFNASTSRPQTQLLLLPPICSSSSPFHITSITFYVRPKSSGPTAQWGRGGTLGLLSAMHAVNVVVNPGRGWYRKPDAVKECFL